MIRARLYLLLASSLALASCQSDKNVAFDRLNSISAGVTASETTYIRQAAEQDCRADLLQRTFDSATGGKPFDAASPCAPFADDALLKEYDVLLKGVAAYTAALQAEQAAGSTSKLDDASKGLATQFGNAAKTTGVLASLGPGNAVATAADSIVSWIFGKITYNNAKDAANRQKDNLLAIVTEMKRVNQAISDHMTTVRNQRIANVTALRFKIPTTNPAETVIVQSQLLEIEGLVPNTGTFIGPTKFDQINRQLDALVQCNNAIALGTKHPSSACTSASALSLSSTSK